MGHLSSLTNVTRFPAVYRAWQAPFVQDKLAPLLRRNELLQARRVLDVGCGPGTNAGQFEHADYLGLDVNEAYIETARRNHCGTFLVADVRTYQPDAEDRFDFILVNSLLHHLDDTATRHILESVHQQLTPDGHIHILELVLPAGRSVSRMLAKLDRGDFPRPQDTWRRMFRSVFQEVVFEPYTVARCGIPLWEMVYFKGTMRR